MSLSIGFITENPFHADLGFSIRTRELSKHMADLGCKVHIFSPADRDHNPYPNIFVHNIAGNEKEKSYDEIRQFLRRFGKNRTIGKLFYLNPVLRIISALAAKKITKLAKGLNLDLLQGTQPTTSSVAVIIGKNLKIPIVAGSGGTLLEEAVQANIFKENSLYYRSYQKFVKFVIDNSNAIITASQPQKDHMIKLYGPDPEKITVIPNGSNPVPVGPERGNRNSQNKIIIFAGILEIWERIDILIDSMPYVLSRFPEVKLHIVGDGRLKNDLTDLVRKKNLSSNIFFLGIKPRGETFQMMMNADIAALPSDRHLVRQLSCPIKLFDYMSAGLPIVTTDVGWWSDLVRDRNAGFVTAADPRSYAEGICSALEDKYTSNVLGENGKRIIIQEYNWRSITEKLISLYKSVLHKRP